MLHKHTVLIGLTIPFALITACAVRRVGDTGIVAWHLPRPAGGQVFFDPGVALILVLSRMINDTRQHRRIVCPDVVAALLPGPFGPFAYMIASHREENATPGAGVGKAIAGPGQSCLLTSTPALRSASIRALS